MLSFPAFLLDARASLTCLRRLPAPSSRWSLSRCHMWNVFLCNIFKWGWFPWTQQLHLYSTLTIPGYSHHSCRSLFNVWVFFFFFLKRRSMGFKAQEAAGGWNWTDAVTLGVISKNRGSGRRIKTGKLIKIQAFFFFKDARKSRSDVLCITLRN